MRRKFQRIFGDMPIGALFLTPDYNIKFTNTAFAEFVDVPVAASSPTKRALSVFKVEKGVEPASS